jgi:hypothetical protein
MVDIIAINKKLKERLAEYRLARKDMTISIHINAIDIATSLVQFAIEEKRPIKQEEQSWFEASYHLSYLLDGSEWEDLSNMYSQICDYLVSRNFNI